MFNFIIHIFHLITHNYPLLNKLLRENRNYKTEPSILTNLYKDLENQLIISFIDFL